MSSKAGGPDCYFDSGAEVEDDDEDDDDDDDEFSEDDEDEEESELDELVASLESESLSDLSES